MIINNPVSFGGNLFSSIPGLLVYSTDPYAGNPRTMGIAPLTRRSARKLNSAFAQSRKINVGIYITRSTRDKLDMSLDALNAIIQGLEQPLVIAQSGTSRQYFCTYDGNPKVNQIAGGFIDMTLTFECSDSFGYDTNYTLINNQVGLASNLVNCQFTQGGSADTQVPLMQIKLTAVTGATGTITLGNLGNGQSVSVTRTWAANDLSIVDSQNKTVTVNSQTVAFSGAIPEFGLNLQTMTYQDTFTTRTFNWFAYVYNRFN